MACAPCNQRRAAAQAAGATTGGTYRVMVGEPGAQRQVYESHSPDAAATVAARFANAKILAPGETA